MTRLVSRVFIAVVALFASMALPRDARAQADGAAFEAVRAADLRLAAIGWRLAAANVALCDRLEAGTGLQLHTLDQFDQADRAAAERHFGFSSPVAIEAIVPGSPAELAGLRADDSLLRVGPVDIGAIKGAPGTTDRLVAAQLAIAALPPSAPVEVEVRRGGQPFRTTLHPIAACRSRFELKLGPAYTGSADGTMVQIGSRFLETYGEDEIAAVVAHEFAHNILRHRERLEARGVSFGMLSGFGANVKYFRQTELQADLLSVYLLNNAGYPMEAAVRFWERFGPGNAGGFLRSRSHPAWRDRIATIEAEIAKIRPLSVRPVVPALVTERSQPLSGDWQALLVRR